MKGEYTRNYKTFHTVLSPKFNISCTVPVNVKQTCNLGINNTLQRDANQATSREILNLFLSMQICNSLTL